MTRNPPRLRAYCLDTIRTNEQVQSEAGQYCDAERHGNEGEMPANAPEEWQVSQDAVPRER